MAGRLGALGGEAARMAAQLHSAAVLLGGKVGCKSQFLDNHDFDYGVL